MVEKIIEGDKAFGKNVVHPNGETSCLAEKGKNQSHDSFRGDGSKRGHGINNFKGRG